MNVMKLGSNWSIFFMYLASPFFNSFLPAKPFDLPINKNSKCSIKITSASFSFTDVAELWYMLAKQAESTF